MTVPSVRPSAQQAYQCLISHFPASLGACNLILYIHVLINWQLSKQCIHWPVSPNRIAGSVISWQVATFQMTAGSSSFFSKCLWSKSCSWAALLKCLFQTDLGPETSTGFYMQGRQSLLTFPLQKRAHWKTSPVKIGVPIRPVSYTHLTLPTIYSV